jgi:hypothetical protein
MVEVRSKYVPQLSACVSISYALNSSDPMTSLLVGEFSSGRKIPVDNGCDMAATIVALYRKLKSILVDDPSHQVKNGICGLKVNYQDGELTLSYMQNPCNMSKLRKGIIDIVKAARPGTCFDEYNTILRTLTDRKQSSRHEFGFCANSINSCLGRPKIFIIGKSPFKPPTKSGQPTIAAKTQLLIAAISSKLPVLTKIENVEKPHPTEFHLPTNYISAAGPMAVFAYILLAKHALSTIVGNKIYYMQIVSKSGIIKDISRYHTESKIDRLIGSVRRMGSIGISSVYAHDAILNGIIDGSRAQELSSKSDATIMNSLKEYLLGVFHRTGKKK